VRWYPGVLALFFHDGTHANVRRILVAHAVFFHDGDTRDGRQGGLTLIFFHGT
jgi:hypothetical protein